MALSAAVHPAASLSPTELRHVEGGLLPCRDQFNRTEHQALVGDEGEFPHGLRRHHAAAPPIAILYK